MDEPTLFIAVRTAENGDTCYFDGKDGTPWVGGAGLFTARDRESYRERLERDGWEFQPIRLEFTEGDPVYETVVIELKSRPRVELPRRQQKFGTPGRGFRPKQRGR